MKLLGSPAWPLVRKVMITAHELGVIDQLECVDPVTAADRPGTDIALDHPLTAIPTLVLEDGRHLFDSAVICEYLDSRFGGPLFPRDGDARWQALVWQALGEGLLDMLTRWRDERERAMPLDSLIDAFDRRTRATLAGLARDGARLADTPLTIGHIAIGCALGYLDHHFASMDWRVITPGLARTFASIEARPAFLATRPAAG